MLSYDKPPSFKRAKITEFLRKTSPKQTTSRHLSDRIISQDLLQYLLASRYLRINDRAIIQVS